MLSILLDFHFHMVFQPCLIVLDIDSSPVYYNISFVGTLCLHIEMHYFMSAVKCNCIISPSSVLITSSVAYLDPLCLWFYGYTGIQVQAPTQLKFIDCQKVLPLFCHMKYYIRKHSWYFLQNLVNVFIKNLCHSTGSFKTS